MPGIVGLISDKNEEVLFDSMRNSLNHKDYDAAPYIKQGVHLSNIDFKFRKTRSEPVHSSDGRYSIVFYGEVFSVEGIQQRVEKESNRYFLQLITDHGMEILAKINGQFSACLIDHMSGTVYLISDRFGSHPIYYKTNKGRLLFASEVKALLKDNFKKEINLHGIAEMFAFGHLFENKTLLEDIVLVPPATIVKWDRNSLQKTQYWDNPYAPEIYQPGKISGKKSQELQEQLANILIEATKRQAVDANDLLIPLSGGLDSRYVAALHHHIQLYNVSTFTMGPDESEDQRFGSEVAHMLKYPHSKFDINPSLVWEDAKTFSYISDGGSFINGPLQIFEPLRHFDGQKKVVSASQMCDVLFGSTLTRKKIRMIMKNPEGRQRNDDVLIDMFKLFDENQIKQLFHPDVYKKINGLYRTVPEQYCSKNQHPLHTYFMLVFNEHGRRGTMGGNLAIGMFCEMRMLSYDNDVLNFGMSLPLAYREHQYLYRKTFSNLFPALASVKRQGNRLPITASNFQYELKHVENKIAAVALRSSLKHVVKYYKPWISPTYTNHAEWFRGQLKEKVTDLLLHTELKCGELLNKDYVKTLVNEHMEGKRNNASLLWQVINLEYFYRNFID